MRQIKFLFYITALLTGLSSCRRNLLDVQPTNLLTNEQIVSSVASVTAYMASLYRDLPIEDFSFVKGVFWTFPDDGSQYTANWSDEASNHHDFSGVNSNDYDVLYKAIRNVNTFIKLVNETSNFSDDIKAAFIGEAKFIRAYYYFELVKFYGGVPLVLEPADEPVNLPRNKEVEIYDQIKADCEDAASALTDDPSNNAKLSNGYTYGYGHANKWVALALEARAMLHAASIGKYGDPAVLSSTKGVNGVDPSHTAIYYQAAFDAADNIMKAGKYSLYMKYPTDLVKNFQYLFYDTKQGDANSEAIFCKGYDLATSNNYTHSEDLLVLPYAIRSAVGYGNALQPSLDLVEKFQYDDGSEGTFGKYATGSPIPGQIQPFQYHFPTITAAFANKDPRYYATIVSNGTQFRNSPPEGITGQRGVIENGVMYTGSYFSQFFDTKTHQFNADPSSFGSDPYVVGTGNSDYNSNPYWLKKWTDPVTDISLIADYKSRTSWMDMRLGEVILDYAEASFELGHSPSEALGAVNQIRERAGMPDYTSIDLDKIRHERMVEFPFENKIWWDYIRWRSFGTDFLNRQEYSLQCYYDLDTKDYVYIKVPNGGPRTYDSKYYYSDIPSSDLTANPLLTHNPGY